MDVEIVMDVLRTELWSCGCIQLNCLWHGTWDDAAIPNRDDPEHGGHEYACPKCGDLNVAERIPIEPDDMYDVLRNLRQRLLNTGRFTCATEKKLTNVTPSEGNMDAPPSKVIDMKEYKDKKFLEAILKKHRKDR